MKNKHLQYTLVGFFGLALSIFFLGVNLDINLNQFLNRPKVNDFLDLNISLSDVLILFICVVYFIYLCSQKFFLKKGNV